MPGKDDARAPQARPARRSFRRPTPELVARAARRLVRGGKASFRSQAEFLDAVLATLRRDEPLAALGGARLRRLVVDVPGVRLTVRYSERPSRPLPSACPVCGAELVPIRNRTLAGGTVELGRRCVRCEYWTHRVLRVPVRYTFSQQSRRRPAQRMPTG